MTTKAELESVKRKAQLQLFLAHEFEQHPEISPCMANQSLIRDYLTENNSPLEAASFVAAVEALRGYLAKHPAPEPIREPEPTVEPWPFSWMPELRIYDDISKKLPGRMFSDFWNDKRPGTQEPTKRAMIFRMVVKRLMGDESGATYYEQQVQKMGGAR